MDEKTDSREAGLNTLRELGWPETGGVPGLDQEFWQHTVKALFGDIWGRPGLNIRDRELITMAVLITLDTDGVVPHFRHACKIGFTEREIRELILHVMYYAGWPRGGHALRRFLDAKNAPDSPWHKVDETGTKA